MLEPGRCENANVTYDLKLCLVGKNMVSNIKNVSITYLESLLYPLGITIEQVDSSIDEGILFQMLKK